MAEPLRMCVVCREMKDKKELLRVVKNKNGEFFVDKTGKLSGRGAYICRNDLCAGKFAKARAFERAFRCALPEGFGETIMKELI